MPRSPTNPKARKSRPASLSDLQRLGLPSAQLQEAAVEEAHGRIKALLEAHGTHFSQQQLRKLRHLLGLVSPMPAQKTKTDDAPRYWLPFSGQTWSGKGRTPTAFLAWEGTVAHTEWKKRHPGERFPRYPG